MAAFDPRVFDGLAFDVTLPGPIHPTLGGWLPAARQESTWAPNDLARCSAWTQPQKGQSTW